MLRYIFIVGLFAHLYYNYEDLGDCSSRVHLLYTYTHIVDQNLPLNSSLWGRATRRTFRLRCVKHEVAPSAHVQQLRMTRITSRCLL